MQAPAQNSTLLELHVPDFEITKTFYEKLGFKVIWERKPEGEKGYLVMKRGNNVLCFWPGNDEIFRQNYFKRFPKETPRGYGVEIVIHVEDVEGMYTKVQDFAEVTDKLMMLPWGLKDFRIVDPFGYYLRITEPHDILDPKYAIK